MECLMSVLWLRYTSHNAEKALHHLASLISHSACAFNAASQMKSAGDSPLPSMPDRPSRPSSSASKGVHERAWHGVRHGTWGCCANILGYTGTKLHAYGLLHAKDARRLNGSPTQCRHNQLGACGCVCLNRPACTGTIRSMHMCSCMQRGARHLIGSPNLKEDESKHSSA